MALDVDSELKMMRSRAKSFDCRRLQNVPIVQLMEQIDRRWMEMESVPADEQHKALSQCLELLKPEDRNLLHTRYATEISLETYAKQEGIRTGTLKARLFRLRDALRDCIDRRLGNS